VIRDGSQLTQNRITTNLNVWFQLQYRSPWNRIEGRLRHTLLRHGDYPLDVCDRIGRLDKQRRSLRTVRYVRVLVEVIDDRCAQELVGHEAVGGDATLVARWAHSIIRL